MMRVGSSERSFFRDSDGIELPPALVEGHPHRKRNAVFEAADRVRHLGEIFPPALLVGAGEEFVVVVADMNADERQDSYRPEAVIRAPGNHVLPDEHALLVAVIVPAQRLDFDVLPYHVEAHGLHQLDIVFQRGVGGRREHPVRPVALVEHAGVEVGLVVEGEPAIAVPVRDDGELPHTEIGAHDVVADLDREVVQLGVFGRP